MSTRNFLQIFHVWWPWSSPFRTENRHTGYSYPGERSNQFSFYDNFSVIELGSRAGQTDRRTGRTRNEAYAIIQARQQGKVRQWDLDITLWYLSPDTGERAPRQAGRYSIYLPRRDRRLSWPEWLIIYTDGHRQHRGRRSSPFPGP